jgi:TonB family protein
MDGQNIFFDRPTADTRKPPQSLILSVALHCALVIGLALLRFAAPPARTPRLSSRILLMAPIAVSKPAPVAAPRKTVEFRQVALKLSSTAPARFPARVTTPVPAISMEPAPALQPAVAAAPAFIVKAAPPAPAAQIHVGGFSTAPTASTGVAKKIEVAPSGFGDAGITAGAPVRRAILTGSGFGDAGVASGARVHGAVSTGGGFGDTNAITFSTGSGKAVRTSEFGDAVSAVPSAGPARRVENAPATAAQILAKPRPAYTEEARRLQIEGEVQLEILFRASGQIDILRVIRGLGHGLDESAAQAARTIRFTPAKKGGQAVDSTATVHIIFQLAS